MAKKPNKPKMEAKPEEPVIDMEPPKQSWPPKTPKSIRVKYLSGNMIHKGRTQSEYHFTGGVAVLITNPIDVKFFMLKAKNNSDTWQVV